MIWSRSSARATACRFDMSAKTPDPLLISKPPKLRPAVDL